MKRLILFILPLLLLSQTLDDLEEKIEFARKSFDVPGLSVAIVKDGQIISSKGYGRKKQSSQEKVDEHTLYAIASNTKAFIATAIGILVQEKKLNWKDKVKKYLPYFELYDNYVTEETSVEDLLCHRVGLGTFSGDFIWYKSNLSPEEVLKRAKYLPQNYGFRAGYGYTNLMFIAAGELIKSVTGKEWHQFVQERIFQPLQMNRSITTVTSLERMKNFAEPHKRMGGKEREIDWVNWDNMGAAGGIISSVDDMAKWLLFNLNQGRINNQVLLNADIHNYLWSTKNNHVVSLNSRKSLPGRNFNGYGLGWAITDYHGRRIINHGGGYDGMYSQVVIIPEENLAFVILTNSMSSINQPLMYTIINHFIKADNRDWISDALKNNNDEEDKRIVSIKQNRVKSTKSSLKLNKYTSEFYSKNYGKILIKMQGSKLRLEFEHAPDLSATLEHWHYDTFEIKWDKTHAWFDFGTLQFVLNNKLELERIVFDVPNWDIFFHEIEALKLN